MPLAASSQSSNFSLKTKQLITSCGRENTNEYNHESTNNNIILLPHVHHRNRIGTTHCKRIDLPPSNVTAKNGIILPSNITINDDNEIENGVGDGLSSYCEQCNVNAWRYTCPYCSIRYCSVACFREHNQIRGNGVDGTQSSSTSSSFCAERMYKRKVNDVLSMERKALNDKYDKYEGGGNGGNEAQTAMSSILSREWEERGINGNGVDDDNLQREEDLYRVLERLEDNADDDENNNNNQTRAEMRHDAYQLPAWMQQEFQRDVASGNAGREYGVKEWVPYWMPQLLSSSVNSNCEEKEESISGCDLDDNNNNHIADQKQGPTLDERILKIPPFSNLYGHHPSISINVKFIVPLADHIPYNTLSMLYAAALTLRIYNGNPCCNDVSNNNEEDTDVILQATDLMLSSCPVLTSSITDNNSASPKGINHTSTAQALQCSTELAVKNARLGILPETMSHSIDNMSNESSKTLPLSSSHFTKKCLEDLVQISRNKRYVLKTLFIAVDLLRKSAAICKKQQGKKKEKHSKENQQQQQTASNNTKIDRHIISLRKIRKKVEFHISWCNIYWDNNNKIPSSSWTIIQDIEHLLELHDVS